MSDREILGLLRASPQEGMTALVNEYAGYVRTIACGKLGDICTCEDIDEAVSDIFVMFYTSGKKREFEIQSLKAYLSVIAKRHCVSVYRSRSRQAETVPLDEARAVPEETADETVRARLIEAIHSLGETDRHIFVRKYFLGQKSRDIAKEMNLKKNTVDKRISRGLVKLRKLLEEEF